MPKLSNYKYTKFFSCIFMKMKTCGLHPLVIHRYYRSDIGEFHYYPQPGRFLREIQTDPSERIQSRYEWISYFFFLISFTRLMSTDGSQFSVIYSAKVTDEINDDLPQNLFSFHQARRYWLLFSFNSYAQRKLKLNGVTQKNPAVGI